MAFVSAKKAFSVATAVGVAGLAISSGTASPVHMTKRIEVAAWGANIGNLIATVKDFLRDTNAYVSTSSGCVTNAFRSH